MIFVQNVVMVSPLREDDTPGWIYDPETAWYARVIMFFTADIKRKGGLPPRTVRLAFVSWFHEYNLSNSKCITHSAKTVTMWNCYGFIMVHIGPSPSLTYSE